MEAVGEVVAEEDTTAEVTNNGIIEETTEEITEYLGL